MFKNFIAGVALALMCVSSASAEFIIDSFNGPTGANVPSNTSDSYTLSNGLSITRKFSFNPLSVGTSLTSNGTNYTFSGTSGDTLQVDYSITAGGPIGSVDQLGGSSLAGLKIDFVNSTTTGTLDSAWKANSNFTGAGAGVLGQVVSSGASTISFLAPSLLNAKSLRFTLSLDSNGSISFERITATPEPTSILMLGSCLAGGFFARRRLKATKAV